MKRNFFSELVTDHKVQFTVYGVIDNDGLPLIDSVFCADSIDNMWACIVSDYESGNGGLGDRIWTACKEQLERQNNACEVAS